MITAVLTDIEGTTSSIHFVKDVLFPFARKRLPAFVETHIDQPIVQHWLHEAAKEAGLISASITEIIDLLQSWIDADRKATPLKALQGMIWQEGYQAGNFKAHIYADAADCLRAWQDAGKKIYVYSSGSVAAQQLFFAHSEAGNLSSLFSGYFDTETGPKRSSASYSKIAESIGVPPGQILFLSDVQEELDAARGAGMGTTLVCRAPQRCPVDCAHDCVSSFDDISLN